MFPAQTAVVKKYDDSGKLTFRPCASTNTASEGVKQMFPFPYRLHPDGLLIRVCENFASKLISSLMFVLLMELFGYPLNKHIYCTEHIRHLSPISCCRISIHGTHSPTQRRNQAFARARVSSSGGGSRHRRERHELELHILTSRLRIRDRHLTAQVAHLISSMDFAVEIQDKLRFRKFKKIPGTQASGCVNEGEAYEVDDDQKVFVKKCDKENACQVVAGEFTSLEAITLTSTVRVPKPLCTVFSPDASSAVIVMEYLSLSRLKSHQQLGQQLSELHGHNEKVRQEHDVSASIIGKYLNNEDEPFVTSFGFDETTCCGHIPMNNQWVDDWESFFARNRLSEQIALIQENYGDRECSELWSKLQLVIPQFFREFRDTGQPITPALLHGDLWSGNAAEADSGAVIFDPASFYGHSEYDLAIGLMFGGFNKNFYDGYCDHKRGLSVTQHQRVELYQLFHYLNHWNHFGSGYREQSLSLMRKLSKMFK